LDIAKLVAGYHSSCNPVNMIASFRNAAMGARFAVMGALLPSVDGDLCRSLPHPFTIADLVEFYSAPHPNPEADGLAASEDLAGLPIYVQLLEEESSKFIE
jgi:hypothetical protein